MGDFGLARSVAASSVIYTRTFGTLPYMPPETIVEGTLSKAADAWSFGVRSACV